MYNRDIDNVLVRFSKEEKATIKRQITNNSTLEKFVKGIVGNYNNKMKTLWPDEIKSDDESQ